MKDCYEVEVKYEGDRVQEGDFDAGRKQFEDFLKESELMSDTGEPCDRTYDRRRFYAVPEAVSVTEHIQGNPFFQSYVYVKGIVGSETHARELEARLKVPFGEGAQSRVRRMEEVTPLTH